ncbi:sugar phosphate isomerase/epimerase [Chloroflexi bacterium TSY]|nr:sugar phosphate isomerase/epimerase [Chloroflexi bacterium TSY]
MKKATLAAQLYTIRDSIKTVSDFADSMVKLRAIGYIAIQLDLEHHPDVPAAEIRRVADDHGLTICIAHFPPDLLWGDLDGIIERQQIWGCSHVAIPYPPNWARTNGEEGYVRLARELTEIGQRLSAVDLTLSYHNHSPEFIRFGNRTGMDIIFEESDPRYLMAELDTYWIQNGGADPMKWIRRMKGRMPVVHYKDMAIGADGSQRFAEVGAGNLNWEAIREATQDAEVDWIVVEQDRCDHDPFDSLRMSYEFLTDSAI